LKIRKEQTKDSLLKIKRRNQNKLKICYFGSYDLREPHNSTYIRGLRAINLSVAECQSSAIKNRDSEEQYKNIFQFGTILLHYLKNHFILLFKFLQIKDVDAIIVGYPGYFDLFLAKLLSIIIRKPLLFNVHISLYETLVFDRKYFSEPSLLSKFIMYFDRLLFKVSDVVLVDTISHGLYFSKLYKLPHNKFVGFILELMKYSHQLLTTRMVNLLFFFMGHLSHYKVSNILLKLLIY